MGISSGRFFPTICRSLWAGKRVVCVPVPWLPAMVVLLGCVAAWASDEPPLKKPETRKLKLTSPEQELTIKAIRYSPDGEHLATATGDWENWKQAGEVKLWKAQTVKDASAKWKIAVARMTNCELRLRDQDREIWNAPFLRFADRLGENLGTWIFFWANEGR